MLFFILVTSFIGLLTVRIFIELNRLYHRQPFVWQTGNKWAVVTGSTDGIGFEFARQLALKGYHLMLISRNEAKLEATKLQISEELKVLTPTMRIHIRTHAADFTRLDIYENIATFLDTAKYDIFILVNNVGTAGDLPNYFLHGKFEKRNEELLNVNLISFLKMTQLVLPSLVEKRQGLVINVSSCSSNLTAPLLSIYSSTKAFMNKLSECLALECRPRDVIFCNFPVWIVSTKMTQNLANSTWIPSPEVYVASALRSIKYMESTIHTTGYWAHTVLSLIWNSFELLLSRRIMGIAMHWYFTQFSKYNRFREQNGDQGDKQGLKKTTKRITLRQLLSSKF